MARKTKLEKIADLKREREELDALMKKLEAEQREVERKQRTNRLCERGGFIESVLPDTVKLDKAQFQDFIKRTLLTEFARRELGKLLPTEQQEPTNNADKTSQAVTAQGVTIAEKPSEQAKK